MKFFAYLMTVILIIALAGLFIFKKPNGQAWLSVNNLLPTTQVIKAKIDLAGNEIQQLLNSASPEKESNVKVYRWKDSNGNWSYSDKPNASTSSEAVFFDAKDIVVLPTIKTPDVDLPNIDEKPDNGAPKTLMTTPTKVLELYKDANNVQKLMDAREDKLSDAIKNSKAG